MSPLYLVATPIGNLEDITLRALRLLREVELIAAEDTRTTRQLLNAYDIKTPVTSYHEHNKKQKLGYLLDCLKEKDVALVSEAGTPGLSDPGYELVKAAIERGVAVVSAPGATAVMAALVVSGLPTDQFTYIGFLPRRRGPRRKLLQSVADVPHTLVMFEGPHRLLEAFEDILAVLGDRKLAVCRELTKVHEEVFRGTASEALRHFGQPRGEFTLVVDGKSRSAPEVTDEMRAKMRALRISGLTARDVVTDVARRTGISRKLLYQIWLNVDKEE